MQSCHCRLTSLMPGACMPMNDDTRQLAVLGLAVITAFGVFAIWPGIDLAISSLFYDPATGFAAIDQGPANALRLAIWRASEAMLAAAIVAVIVGWVTGGNPLTVPRRVWGYIVALYLLGPGLLADVILKPFWGRARPEDVAEFGGQLLFTPPHRIAGQCSRNCSFVAGEMAGAVALAVALTLILHALRERIPTRYFRLTGMAILLLPLYAGFQRIAAGRHFLSDVIFATLVVLMVAVALRALMLRRGKD